MAQELRARKGRGWAPSRMGQGTDFFESPHRLLSQKVEARFESLSEIISCREYWWDVLGIWGRSVADSALQEGSAAVVWVGSLVMLHSWLILWVIPLTTHTEAGIFVSLGFKLVRTCNINVCISLQENLLPCRNAFLPLWEALVPSFPTCKNREHISEEENPSQQKYFPSKACKRWIQEPQKRAGQQNQTEQLEVFQGSTLPYTENWNLPSANSHWSTSLKGTLNSHRKIHHFQSSPNILFGDKLRLSGLWSTSLDFWFWCLVNWTMGLLAGNASSQQQKQTSPLGTEAASVWHIQTDASPGRAASPTGRHGGEEQ